MSVAPNFLSDMCQQAERLLAKVVSRDNLDLAPRTISKTAAKRLRQGIRALEAFLRRVLMVMALTLEPHLAPRQTPYTKYARQNKVRPIKPRLNIFTGERNIADLETYLIHTEIRPKPNQNHGPIPAAPLLEKLSALKTLIANPEARARRLAYTLARKRPGPLLAPDIHRGLVPNRLGTEISSLYQGLAAQIGTLSRGRPPPLGPAPRAPPRIRML